ncbi:MAG: Asp-tRNA(Asn)/Glu-tRNA(Gln) amidotransferase subunit GatB [Ekhidna sp.]|nr:Asp-tRNA(Asn)/Glu-tRNA(Gln) amidotransferase subunit GatB [Ekhidna sp.]
MEQFSDPDFELVVGLEIHIQLATDSKLFAGDSTDFHSEPNSNLSVITLAHPGTMPMLNETAIEYAVRMGIACESTISRYCIFDRKNYFYPDLPKGFQTTQDLTPICVGGSVELEIENGNKRSVQLNRIHLEEDAGKSIHDMDENRSMIDLNRAGIPLIELVTEPCIGSEVEAINFLKEIRQMVRFLEICDGNMEQGSMRCDANISVKRRTETELGSKVEVKNMNSMRNVGKAITHEFERQTQLLNEGLSVVSETRLFDVNTGTTSAMRTKEELNDYRYFPEPDLSPFTISDERLEKIIAAMPASPKELRSRFQDDYQLSKYDAEVLTSEKSLAEYFEEVCKKTTQYKQVANWIQGPIKSMIDADGETTFLPITSDQLADIVNLIADGELNNSEAKKKVLPFLRNSPELSVDQALESLNLKSPANVDNTSLVLDVLNAFPDKVVAYKKGKKNLLGLFMGEVMKKAEGRIDPQTTKRLIEELIEKQK